MQNVGFLMTLPISFPDEEVDTLSESITTIDLTESDDEENIPTNPIKIVNAPPFTKSTDASTKVVPLGENNALLNRARQLVDSVTSTVRSFVSTDYNESTLTNSHRNNQARNHNQRPYERNWNRQHSSGYRNSPRRNNYSNSPRRNFNNRPYNNSRNWFDSNSSRNNTAYSSNTGYSSWNTHYSSNRNNNYNQSNFRNYRSNSYNSNYNSY